MPEINQTLEIADFSGGMTDYIFDAAQNQYEFADNVWIDVNGKMRLRNGIAVASQRLIGQGVPGRFAELNSQILVAGNGYINRNASVGSNPSSTWTAVQLHTISQAPWFGDLSIGNNIVNQVDSWNGHLFWTGIDTDTNTVGRVMKVASFVSPTSGMKAGRAGLPNLYDSDTAPVTMSLAGGSGFNYIYYLVLRYDYSITVGGDTITFQDVSAPLIRRISSTTAIGVGTNTIGSLVNTFQTIVSTSTGWDGTNIYVDIYRTINNGVDAYLVGSTGVVSGFTGATTFADNVADTTLIDRAPFYANGGIVFNNEPPKAKYFTVTGNVGWYAYCNERNSYSTFTGVKSNRIRHSVANDIDSCPLDFSVDVEGEIVALTQVDNVPIVITKYPDRIYRLEGGRDIFGGGEVTARIIAEHVTCVSDRSFFRTINGFYFAGRDGFYFCDGNSVLKISRTLDKRYSAFTGKSKIVGTYDQINRRAIWGVSTDAVEFFPNHFYIFDETRGIKPDGVFTRWVPPTPQGSENWQFEGIYSVINPISVGSQILLGTRNVPQNAIFAIYGNNGQADAYTTFTDVVIPNGSSLTDIAGWNKNDILFNYESASFDFSLRRVRKWVSAIYVLARNNSEDSVTGLLVSFLNDDKSSGYTPLALIKWTKDGIINLYRRFKHGKLRCTTKRIKLASGKIVLQTSDDNVTAQVFAAGSQTIDGVTYPNAQNVLLENASFNWLTTAENKVISFDSDGYVAEYLILNLNSGSDTIAINGPGAVVGTGKKWVIRGYTAAPVIDSYSMDYSVLGDFTGPGESSSAGNA